MIKFFLAKGFLLALFLCLCAAHVQAQQPQLMPPPLPNVVPSPPPDPDTLPPPPQLQWDSLVPRDSGGEAGAVEAVVVPPPQPEPSIAPPPPPAVENPVPGAPDPSQLELAKPDVEVWRTQSESPQIPARVSNRLDQAYFTGTEPVALKVQFSPLAAGKIVYVKPGRGITLEPPLALLTVSSSGECLIQARFAEGLARSHIVFYCGAVKTVLPVVRASLATVVAAEEETGGGH